jgi:ribose 5-phosphate isomerase B
MTKKIVIASDHGGFELKEFLIKELTKEGYKIIDFGTKSSDSVDYPEYAQKVAKAILNKEFERGILICGTGIGICISANRFKGIRAGLCHTVEDARLSRQHNNANIICFGGRTMDKKVALECAKIFMITEFEGGRHKRRIDKIDKI